MTVASTNPPEAMVDGARLKLARCIGAGVIVRRAVVVSPRYPPVAEIVAEPDVTAEFVATVNVAVLAPEETVTLAGTVATLVSEDARVMTTPPAGAFPSIATVPVDSVPPVRLKGLKETDERTAGSTVSVAFCVTPP